MFEFDQRLAILAASIDHTTASIRANMGTQGIMESEDRLAKDAILPAQFLSFLQSEGLGSGITGKAMLVPLRKPPVADKGGTDVAEGAVKKEEQEKKNQGGEDWGEEEEAGKGGWDDDGDDLVMAGCQKDEAAPLKICMLENERIAVNRKTLHKNEFPKVVAAAAAQKSDMAWEIVYLDRALRSYTRTHPRTHTTHTHILTRVLGLLQETGPP